jgi:hypothetical protein
MCDAIPCRPTLYQPRCLERHRVPSKPPLTNNCLARLRMHHLISTPIQIQTRTSTFRGRQNPTKTIEYKTRLAPDFLHHNNR